MIPTTPQWKQPHEETYLNKFYTSNESKVTQGFSWEFGVARGGMSLPGRSEQVRLSKRDHQGTRD